MPATIPTTTDTLSHAQPNPAPITNPKMTDLVTAAELLRSLRAAEDHFLGQYALDCLLDDRRVIEKFVADLHGTRTSPSSGDHGWTMK